MGTLTYDFLAESILFDDRYIQKSFSDFTDDQIEQVLADYREHCLKGEADLNNEISSNKSSLKVLSGIKGSDYNLIKQGALYLDQFIIYDPLFEFARPKNKNMDGLSQYLGYDERNLDRERLVSILSFLKRITPMIEANYVKMLPLSHVLEPPKEMPLILPKNYYADDLPQDLMEFCRKRAIVRSMLPATNGGWYVKDELDLTPTVCIEFDSSDMRGGFMYHYCYTEFGEEKNGIIDTKMTLAPYPVKKEEWDIWVYQNINRSSKHMVDKIYLDNYVANKLKTTYLTDNKFTADLLSTGLSSKETVETACASQYMNIELPFLDRVDINKLMSIRMHEEEIFTNFRLELERQLRELRGITDEKELLLRQENIVHELSSVQLKKLDQKLKSIKRKSAADAVMFIAGLSGISLSGGLSLLASAGALAHGYKTYNEYKEGISENPSYLLWQVLRKAD